MMYSIPTSGIIRYPNSYSNIIMGTTSFDTDFYDFKPKVQDCNNKELEKGDRIVYSKGKYGYLQESIIIKITNKSIMLEDGHWISLNSLNRTRKI